MPIKNQYLNNAGIYFAVLLFVVFLVGIISIIPTETSAAPGGFGDSIPEITCSNGMEATIYAEGLGSPDGLAFDSNGLLHVAQETAGGIADGKISQISSTGVVTDLLTSLVRPEGIAFDTSGNLYYVDDDISNGGVIMRTPAGVLTTIASNSVITSPEGIAIGADGTIYVTASDAEKAAQTPPTNLDELTSLKTYLYAFAPTAPYTMTTLLAVEPNVTINSLTSATIEQPSFSGITIGNDGKIYFASESSGIEGSQTVTVPPSPLPVTVNITSTRSVFVIDPANPPADITEAPAPFIENLTAVEGLRFQISGFPLLVVEEGAVGENSGRLVTADASGNTSELCAGFGSLEDVITDADDNIYVTDDTNNRVVKLAMPLVDGTATAQASATSAANMTATAQASATPGANMTATAQASATSAANMTATAQASATSAANMTATAQANMTATASAQMTATAQASGTPTPESDPVLYLPIVVR